MRLLTATAMLAISACAWGQSAPASQVELRNCSEERTAKACGVSKTEYKQAQRNFAHALELQKQGKTEEAFDAAEAAARLVSNDTEYMTAREILRQKLVLDHLKLGNALVAENNGDKARAEFRKALALDPTNSFAQQRLKDAAPPVSGNIGRMTFQDSDDDLSLRPAPGTKSFHYRGDNRGLFTAVAREFGLAVEFDETVQTRQLRFDVDDVDFWTALRVACKVTKTFWVPLSDKRFLLLAENTSNRAQFERVAVRTFYLPDATTAQELNDVLNILRTMFDFRQVVHQPESMSITVRAPKRMIDTATELLITIDQSRPQVMLEFHVLQISESMLKDFGLEMPLQWQAFNVTGAALAALQQPDIQALINQLLSSGNLNAANTSSIAALLQQLQNQQNNALFKNPFATFGGGLTRFAIPWPPSTFHFSMNSSQVYTLQDLTLRASQGNAATMRMGSRYPIITASFSAGQTTPGISQLLGNQGQNQNFTPFPSFTFEDLGVTVKATPQIHQSDVTLDLNMEIKALTGSSLNGVPVISNRNYTGAMSVRDGETVALAGTLDNSESNSLTGLPGISSIPGLNKVLSHNTPQNSHSELLVLITPHILRRPPESSRAIVVPTVD